MIAGTLEIQLLANLARLQRDMDQAKSVVNSSMAAVERSVERAKLALAGLGAGLGIQNIIKLTDEYTKFTSQLKLATTGATAYAIALNDVRRISKDAQADLSATGILYARITNGTRELGLSQSKVADITETVSLALKASGATTQESASAMLQLSQAFGSGVLRGQEFNAVNEAAPRLMRALADGIGVPVGQLREMAEAGKLTSEVMANALPRAMKDLRVEAAAVQTISGAFTVLKNSVMEFIGLQSQANGTVTILTTGIKLLSDNLQLLAAALAGIAAAKIAQWFTGITVAIYTKTTALMASVTAMQAERAAAIASTGAEVARIETTLAVITVERARTLAQMQSAQATMAATAAIGAQSAALAANTAATAINRAAVTSLAGLNKAASIAAGQLAAAQTAQAAALTSSGVAAGFASRALGFLGGPIGVITTLLGLGVTAWMAWGSASDQQAKRAEESIEKSTAEIIADLDQQIKKLKERNEIAAAGLGGIAKSDSESAAKMVSLRAQMNDVQAGKGQFKGLDESARSSVLQALGMQYGELYGKIQLVNAEQEKFDAIGQNAKADKWLEKYATSAEKLAAELAKAKKELGAAFSSDLEQRIRDSFGKKDITAYENSVKDAKKFIESLKEESAQIGLEKDQIKMMAAAKEAAKAPTDALRNSIINEAFALVVKTKAHEAEKEAAKQSAEMQKKFQDAASGAWDQVAALQEEIRTYGLLESAITSLAITKVESKLNTPELTEAETAALESQLFALQKLRDLQGKKEGLDGLKDVDKFLDPARAQEFGDVLKDAFGSAGDSIVKLTKSFSDYTRVQSQNAKQQEAIESAKKAGLKVDVQQAALDKKIARDRVGAYGDMAHAAQGFFEEGSDGYKTLGAISKAFHMIEMAMAIQSMITNVTAAQTKTAANVASIPPAVAAGGAQMFAQSGWGGFIGVAAMLAVMAALGFAGGGGGGSPNLAADRQAAQGTGTVLGDPTAKSESISNSIEHLKDNSDLSLPISQALLASSRNIESALTGFAQMIIRTPGLVNGSSLGVQEINKNTLGKDMLGKIIPTNKVLDALAGGSIMNGINMIASWWGKTKQSVTDSGLSIKGTLAELESGMGVRQYANVYRETKRAFGLSRSSSNSTLYGEVDSEITDQLSKVFRSMGASLKLAAESFGYESEEIAKKISEFIVDIPFLSLHGLSGEKLSEALNNAFSKISDDMAKSIIPGFEEFQRVGEGYYQTIIRTASGIEASTVALDRFGITAIDFADVINKQGDVGVEIMRQSIEAVETGANGVLTGIGLIVDAFDGTVSDLTDMYRDLLSLRRSANNTNVDGNNISAQMIQGAGGAQELQSGFDAYFDKFFSDDEKSAAKVKNLSDEFDRLGIQMPTTLAGFRELVGSIGTSTAASQKLTGSLIALADPFYEALTDATKGFEDLVSSLTAFRDSLNGTSNSDTKTQSTWEALNRAYTASLAGDTTAAGKIEGLAKSYLDAKMISSGSRLDYARGEAAVIRMIDSVIAATQTQAALAMQMAGSGSMYAGGTNSFDEATGVGSVGVKAFAAGGDFGGGWRIVGESGPELEATGPSRIFNASQTRSLLGGGAVEELQALRQETRALHEEIAGMRSENNAGQFAIARNTEKVAKVMERNDTGDGLLITETVPG